MSRILIVDDSVDLLDAIEYFLRQKGYEVATVTTGEDLLPIIRLFSPDVIFIDIFMPGEDGREICKKLRATLETKYICIILFSASGLHLKNYKEYGADNYIEKPFGLDSLIQKIEETLDLCRAHS